MRIRELRQRRRPEERRIRGVRALLPAGRLAELRGGPSAAGSDAAADIRTAVARVARAGGLRVLLRPAGPDLPGPAAVRRRCPQPRLRPPARRLPDATRALRDGPG